jgi:hypothetical protein
MAYYNIYGSITININIDIEAETDEIAMEMAQEQIIDEFRLYNEEVNFYIETIKTED